MKYGMDLKFAGSADSQFQKTDMLSLIKNAIVRCAVSIMI